MTRFLKWTMPLLVVAAPALAQPASTDPAATAAAQTSAATAKPKKICRTETVTGRRISSRRCYTAEQWADYDKAAEAQAKKFVNDVNTSSAKANLAGGGTGGLSTSSMFGLGQ